MSSLMKSMSRSRFVLNRIIPALLLALLVVAAGPLFAKDLGVYGRVWDIIEIDIRELLIQSAGRINVQELQDKMRQSAESYLDNLPRRSTLRVTSTRTRWLDPSFVLDDDIRVPIRNEDGEWEWGILHKKGTRFNPLSVQRPRDAMLFFDGEDQDQLKFVEAVVKEFPGKVMPVEATGANPDKLAQKLGVPVFSATDQMRARFRIEATPALLYAGEGEHSLELGMTEFAPPYTTAAAERAWPSIRSPLSRGTK